MGKFLNVQFADGRVYENSKEPKDGFEEFISSKGNKSYRKYYNKGVFGTLTAVEKRESPIGDQIQLTLKDKDGEYVNLQFNLYDANGTNVDERFAEAIIRTLPNMRIQENYRIYPYVIKEEGQKYEKSGVSVHTADIVNESKLDKVDVAYRYLRKDEQPTANDVPKLEWKEQRGKNRPTAASMEAKANFLYDVLMGFISASQQKSANNTATTTPTVASAPKPVEQTKSFFPENDNLPF